MFLLEKGTKVFLSAKGHKGFFYPDLNTVETLIEDTDATKLVWVGSTELSPVLIPEVSIFASGDSKNKIPVWVEKEMIKSVKAT